jgi:Protein of unknown function (DUF3810)
VNRNYILPFFLFFQILFLKVVAYFPNWVEQFYSNSWYEYSSNFSRILLGKVPFSVGDCLYIGLIFLILKWFWNVRKSWKYNWKTNILKITSCLSVFYFCFHLLWAFNYYRQPLFEKMKIERAYTDADLLHFTQKLIEKTNQIQLEITQKKQSRVVIPYNQNQIFEMNLNGYANLAIKYPFLLYKNQSVKKSIFSLPLTYMGFGGYLNPFTNEAQVNNLGPKYSFAMTANHEMAHQLGYASESECNFIGFLACTKNDDLYIKYSGYSLALRYCMGNWQNRNLKMAKALQKTIHPGILKNYQESQDFWKQYETPIEKGFKIFYDNFLKINQQKDGLESYSKFVDLMVNFYKDKLL